MKFPTFKILLVRLLRRLGMSEAVLARLSRIIRPGYRKNEKAIIADYEALREHLGGGLPPVTARSGGPRTMMISLFDEFYFLKVDMALARALVLAGHDVTVVKSIRSRHVERYFRLLGITQFITIEEYEAASGGHSVGFAECAALRPPFTFASLMAFKVGHFNLGEHILSTLLAMFRIGHLDLNSLACRNFVQSWLDVLPIRMAAVRRIFDKVRPDNFILNEKGYLPNALFWDEALHRQVNFIQWHPAQETNTIVLKKYNQTDSKDHPLSLSEQSWSKLKGKVWTEALDRSLAEMFRQRYEKNDWYNRNVYRAPAPIISAEDVRRKLNLDNSKKTAVVFSHILWDATFFFGENIFQDYEVWLLETIKEACANPNLNWIVKLHPDYTWKLARVGGSLDEPDILKREFGELPPHVQLMLPDSPINTYSLFQVADYCVTVRGTAGIEMACFGKPVLTAGTGRYFGLGFTLDSRSADEYRRRLGGLHNEPPLDVERTILARRFAYALYKLRPFRHASFSSRVNERNGPGHPLFLNYDYHFRNAEEFAAASDLKAFADWFDCRDQPDFLSDWPDDPVAPQTDRLRMPWDRASADIRT